MIQKALQAFTVPQGQHYQHQLSFVNVGGVRDWAESVMTL